MQKRSFIYLVFGLLGFFINNDVMASNLTPQAKADFEVFLQYWGEVFNENFIKSYESVFEKNENFAFESQILVPGASIHHPGYLDFNENVHSSLQKEPIPPQFVNNTSYVHELIKGFFKTEDFYDLLESYRSWIYIARNTKNSQLYKDTASKIIGLTLIMFVQDDYVSIPAIDKNIALPKLVDLLENVGRFDISDHKKVSRYSTILFTITQLLKYKHSQSKDDYFYFMAGLNDKFANDYKDKFQEIPEFTSRQLFDLLVRGMKMTPTEKFPESTFLDDFEKYWPAFKKYIPYHENGGKDYYSKLGIVRELAKKYGYLSLSDDITLTRMKLLSSDEKLTPNTVERQFLRSWGYLTEYGSSFRRLISIFLIISFITFLGAVWMYKPSAKKIDSTSISETLKSNIQPFLGLSLYSKAGISFLKIATLKGDEKVTSYDWFPTIAHVLFFIFYTLFLGQIVTFIVRNI